MSAMTNKYDPPTTEKTYDLKATGLAPTETPELVSYILERKKLKDEIWEKRNNKLVNMASKLEKLISIYNEHNGEMPSDKKEAFLFYKSALAHQIMNELRGAKLDPDFIDYSPLGAEHDTELLQKSKNLTQAHKAIRYKGDYNKARLAAKGDFIWGNAFIEMSTHYEGDDPMYTEYTHAPFKEVRNFYGDTDIMRIIDYSIKSYVKEYGKDMLTKVALGGITSINEFNQTDFNREEYDTRKDVIQVVRYYDPSLRIFGEVHGGTGYIYKNLEGDDYPFMWKDNQGFSPFKESRFFEQVASDYFGWGVMDYVINLANLETTITNLTAMEAVWDAGAPSFIFSNAPDDMEQKINKHLRNLNRGINKPIVQKDSSIGTKGQIQTLKKGVDNRNMQVWDEVTKTRAVRFSNVDVDGLSDYAPTAEQQKLQVIKEGKLNIRVLQLNEEREKEFAVKEMEFIRNGTTAFHKYKIDIVDDVAEKFESEDGYMPTIKVGIGDILQGVSDAELKIEPRLDGVFSDMDFMEIQTMQQDMAMLQVGSAARDIAMEKYFAKKNPNWGLKREDFSLPTPLPPEAQPQAQGVPQQGQPPQQNNPTNAITKQLAMA